MDDRPLIRDMTLADCDRVAEIRVRGWQRAYRDLIPRSFLDAMSVAEDAERRRSRFTTAGEGVVNLVAEREGQVVGWACHGPYREGELLTGDAELYAMYVDVRHLGDGLGHALIQESLRRCTAAGHPRMLLWVLKGNARARRFYERQGFRADGTEEPFEVDGALVPEVRYGRDLTG
jgi:L-amino acid N-acyltransferase YncA